MATVAARNGVVVYDDEGRQHTLYFGQPIPENPDKEHVKALLADGFLTNAKDGPEPADAEPKGAAKKAEAKS